MNFEQLTPDIHNLSKDEAQEKESAYREASRHFLGIYLDTVDMLLRSSNPDTVIAALGFAVGARAMEGISMSDMAAKLNTSPQNISKYVLSIREKLKLPVSQYCYKTRKAKAVDKEVLG